MAIGSWGVRSCRITGLAAMFCLGLAWPGQADDQIQLASGATVSGQILGVSGDQVTVQITTASGSTGKTICNLSDIKSVTMDPPAEIAGLANASPASVISTLDPLVKNFAGLPAPWVVDAMAQLADAYESSNQPDKAQAIYTSINQLYPNSRFQNAAVAGTAQLALDQGKPEAALAALQPVVDKANQDMAPSPEDAQSYARAFLVYGQALQAEKQDAKALEAYLTVKTMFYQNPALVTQAEQLVAKLRQQDPNVGVE